MTPLSLAAAHIATTPRDQDHSLADTFARELVETQERLEAALSRNRQLVGERDRIASPRPRLWPVVVRCDGCRTEQPFHTADEPRVLQALIALGWTVDSGHRCPGCAK